MLILWGERKNVGALFSKGGGLARRNTKGDEQIIVRTTTTRSSANAKRTARPLQKY